MALSISSLTREHAETINKKLEQYAQALHPSSAEDEEVVRRAVFSVRNKSVKLEKYNPKSNTVFGTVYDVRPADVSFSLTSGELSCSCPQNMCRHKLGLLLQLFQYIGSVQEWTSSWRAKKSAALKTLAGERSPDSWSRMVHEVTSHLLPENKKIEVYLFSNVIENIHLKLRKFTPLEREWQPVFKLFIEIAVLNHVWTHLLSHEQKFTSDYIEFTLQKRIASLKDTLQELPSKTQLFSIEPFYDAIQHELRKFVMQPDGLDAKRYDLYLTVWKHLFDDHKRAKNELQSITNYSGSSIPVNFVQAVSIAILKERKKAPTPETKQLNLLGLDNLESPINEIKEVLPEEDLTTVLNATSLARVDLAVPLAQFLIDTNRIESAGIVLRAILPNLKEHINQLPRMYREYFCRNVHDLYKQLSLSEQDWILLYGAFGRFGVIPYAEYLLTNRLYDEWIALHQLFPSSIAHLEAIGLKEVIDQSPSSALPLYHFYAMEELRQKSRMNYKQAVRIWRAMKATAKKANKMNYFDDYIDAIRQQYKRLRALQEELDKANL